MRRGHRGTYASGPAFRTAIEAAGASFVELDWRPAPLKVSPGGQTSGDKYALIWQWSGGGGSCETSWRECSLQGLGMPSINAIMSKQLGPERQGELQGGMASVMGLASIFGPITLTQTLAHFSARDAHPRFPGAAFLLASLLAAISLVLLVVELRGSQVGAAPTRR